jgi:hypothetical protein
MTKSPRVKLLLRSLLLITWVALLVLLLQRDFFIKKLELHEAKILKEGRQTDFLAVYFQKERIGYVKNRLAQSPTGNDLSLFEDAVLNLNILGETHIITMQIEALLSPDLLLKEFNFHLVSPFYETKASGTVNGQDIRLTIVSGKETIRDTIHLKGPPFLPINQRGYLLSQDLKEGDKLSIPYFDPISLTGKNTVIEYKGIEKVLVRGRIHTLHHFVENFVGVRINTWLDDKGKVVKEESPAGFVFLAEPEFMATDIGTGGTEILRSVSVPLTGSMPDYTDASRITYLLTLPEGVEFSLDKDRQQFAEHLLTLNLETLDNTGATACEGLREELAATPYIQAQNKKISTLSTAITRTESSALGKVRALVDWVYNNLEKRPVLGIPDALTTLQTRRGDCNEHASLFAALARSAGIPTRVVAGVTFHEGAFFYHAWNEVCLGKGWLSLDTTTQQMPADLTHIKFVEGEIEDMVAIGALIGKLQIEVVEVSR